ncbi:hypothetical protein Pla52o_56220 [Novipirellula galeiformis]|uniref:Polyketide synthase n=1 Tax=Novipirellula galeiformis TaxID=2528004 RepID=A0A5C6BL46_9BACT|nr:polyketide synthase [Novipirellula galeiformis]TWU11184.1 hypothetical protein Pla52o_56220 [Novipirellula galeiformis]
MGTPLSLDPKLRRLIDSLRQRIRRYVIVDSLLAIAAVVLAAFWLGLALDYGPVLLGGTEMPPLARLILLLVVAVTVLMMVARLLIGRLRRPLPDDSLALLVERQHPHLGGRLVTTVQLNRSDRDNDSHAPELLKRVHLEATAAIDQVDTTRIFTWQPILRKTMFVAPMLLAALALLLLNPTAFARATTRLTLLSNDPWPRRATLDMVGIELPVISATDEEALAPTLVEFEEKVIQLPRGSSGTLRIRALAEAAEVPVVCTVYYRSDDGTRGQSNMRRIGRVVDGYQSFVLDGPPLAGLSDSMTLSVRGLDARLDDFRIEAVTPPAITRMNVSVRYPEYLRPEAPSEFDLRTDYQAGLRLREGSEVVLTATSSVPLGDTEVVLRTDSGEFERAQWIPSEDRREGQIVLNDFTRSTAVRIVPRDQQGISAQAPYRYFFGVVTDEPPELQMRLRGIGTAVTAIAKMPVEVVAKDDYGIESLEVSVTPLAIRDPTETQEAPGDPASDPAGVSMPLKWDRQGDAATEIDLREWAAQERLAELAPGSVINVFAEARDGYDLGKSHLTRSELFRLEIVTPEKLLALLERRELALRGRLEQTIDETRNLRDTLDRLRRIGFEEVTDAVGEEADDTRTTQVRLLRVQQTGLQANKTSEELSGIAASLDDLLQEMINNRVDSVDRRERIGEGVRDPLKNIVSGPLQRLKDQIHGIEQSMEVTQEAARKTGEAVQTAEDVLLQLTAVLEKMLDLESYNEILDMVRELIEDQDELLEETKAEQKKRVLDLFK